MACAQILLSLFLLSPCESSGSGLEVYRKAVAHADRPAADRERDVGRHPAKVLAFGGIQPGMQVLDVFAGGGYYTEILNHLVGSEGRVLSHNNVAYENFLGDELQTRFADGRLPHVDRVTTELDDLSLQPGSLDAVLMILTWHDFLYGNEQYQWPDADEAAFVQKLCRAAKPGASLILADHVAQPGGEPADIAANLHRIDPQQVKDALRGSCWELSAESDLLRNSSDDHTQAAILPALRGQTDRFLFKFVRR